MMRWTITVAALLGAAALPPTVQPPVAQQRTLQSTSIPRGRPIHASARDCSSIGRFNDYSTCVPDAADWSATNVRGTSYPQVMELRIPMRLIGASPGSTIGIALNVTDTRSIWNFWPASAEMAHPGSWAAATIER